jgi:hypothetical protein
LYPSAMLLLSYPASPRRVLTLSTTSMMPPDEA